MEEYTNKNRKMWCDRPNIVFFVTIFTSNRRRQRWRLRRYRHFPLFFVCVAFAFWQKISQLNLFFARIPSFSSFFSLCWKREKEKKIESHAIPLSWKIWVAKGATHFVKSGELKFEKFFFSLSSWINKADRELGVRFTYTRENFTHFTEECSCSNEINGKFMHRNKEKSWNEWTVRVCDRQKLHFNTIVVGAAAKLDWANFCAEWKMKYTCVSIN